MGENSKEKMIEEAKERDVCRTLLGRNRQKKKKELAQG
jgi:hypothetical protein